MNINPSAAASVAGTARAAAKGGEADNQASESTRQQSTADKPGGKVSDSNAVDAGDQTGDRGGDGRQVLDLFQKSDDGDSAQESKPDRDTSHRPSPDGAGEHLDLEA